MADVILEKNKRILNIELCQGLFDFVSASKLDKDYSKTHLEASDPPCYFYTKPETHYQSLRSEIYNMPFLLLEDGNPWWEANAFFVEQVRYNTNPMARPTDDLHRKASRLLSYKMFCEERNIDWLNFSGRRPSTRPTYRFYHYLIHDSGLSNGVISQFTGAVYSFYEYVAKNWHVIDLERVDSVKTVRLFLEGKTGSFTKEVKVRQLRRPMIKSDGPEIGYVRENGEDLRPLSKKHREEFLKVINGSSWAPLERLICLSSMFTGARKQSVLTLRMKHLASFVKENLNNDGTYTVHAGAGTSIDTKFGKKQTLYFPQQLAHEMFVYANSDVARARREKFKHVFASNYPNMEMIKDEDIYLFLSDQGNCYYMAKDDPRYPKAKAPPTGQVTGTLRAKLFKFVEDDFPKNFTFHWLRATYAYMYYLWLQPLVEAGYIKIGEEISLIQRRLHHNDRATTEEYLKLFSNINEVLDAQEKFESVILNRKMFDHRGFL
ncbi:site-specific recombinase, phage integrase family [Halomonas citrativorans]|uniref:Site-specific recombinase, phage integrase family n=1 Tax=Halomonas citrativorans TaxID=2742612 RepID=A0A1R4HMZ8_9GAMM|nr:site-specific integrase [Halomonas citrativorans]SJN08910.1 site-specific recombinase, phage integrase family [Halomonas citrativorans]